MKCISLWQPFATLWLLEGEKQFETRSWHTSHRGPLLVHAAGLRNSQIKDFSNCSGVREALWRHNLLPQDLAFGSIIGEVDIIGCWKMSDLPEPSEREASFGNWAPGRYAWERAPNARIYSKPIPYAGSQRVFNVREGAVPR